MSDKHTPGPWTFEADDRGNHFCLNTPAYRIIHGDPATGGAWMGHRRWKADATLIAASPDLLAACESGALALEEAANILAGNGYPSFADILRRGHIAPLRAAIAKATEGNTEEAQSNV